METKEILANYYQNYDEDGRLLTRRGQVEYQTTMHFIQRYLKPGMRILEIGAATGRYSHALARMGYQVDAVELIEHNIELFKQNTQPGERVTITQGNATDLSTFAEGTYDMTLLLGPLYHLFTRDEQHQALKEALRVTKPGGLLYAAYCSSDSSVFDFCFKRGYLMDPHFYPLVDKETYKLHSDPEDRFALHRPEEIDALMSDLPADRLHFAGADIGCAILKESLETMSEEMYQHFLHYHAHICERRELIGFTSHFLDISRKRKA